MKTREALGVRSKSFKAFDLTPYASPLTLHGI